MCNCRMGMCLVTATALLKSLFPPMSDISLEGVLEWPTELGVSEPDCRESRPPASVSAWSSILKDGMGAGTGLRGIGGRPFVGGAEGGSAILQEKVAGSVQPCVKTDPPMSAAPMA